MPGALTRQSKEEVIHRLGAKTRTSGVYVGFRVERITIWIQNFWLRMWAIGFGFEGLGLRFGIWGAVDVGFACLV